MSDSDFIVEIIETPNNIVEIQSSTNTIQIDQSIPQYNYEISQTSSNIIEVIPSHPNIIEFDSGQLGLTIENIDDRIGNVLKSGYGISLFHDDLNNTLTISTVGLQPSGNYSLVGHNHIISDVDQLQIILDGKQPSGNYALLNGANFIGPVTIPSGTGNFQTLTVNNIDVSISGHTHNTSDINNFVSDVNNLIPVTNILSGQNITISQSGTVFTVAVTGSLGLTTEEVDDRISNLLISGTGISLNYDDQNNQLIINTSGLQPSGNYSLVGHSHISSDITDFNSAVSGLLPPVNFSSLSGISGVLVTNNNANYIISLSDPTIQLADITDLSLDAKDFLNTPSSENFSKLITNETGSGYLVFNNSPLFTGIPLVPTAQSGTNSNQIASTAFVRNEISNLVDSAPDTLDTLNELAAALGDDANFATTVTNSLSSKANLSGAIFTGPIYIPSGTGNFNVLTVNNTAVSISGHTHYSNNIIDFDSSVSGLLPVKNISAGSGIGITSNLGDFTVSVTGSFGLTGEEVDDRVHNLLVAGNYIDLNYDDNNNILTIMATGLQPSGNYSLVGHNHASSDITDFNSSVSGLIPVKGITSGTGINISSVSGIYTITSTGSGVSADQSASLVTTVFNKTGSPIPKMTAVYINGGQGDMPTVSLGIATGDMTSAGTYGLTYETISNMTTGKVIVFGALTGLDTDQFNPSAPHGNVNGQILYLSPTISGALTLNKPSAPNHIVAIGSIVRTHQNEGVIEVRIQNGFELEELHNVAISGATNGQFLQYNTASGLWLASSSGNFTNLLLNDTNVSVSGHTHSSSDITNFNSSVSGLLPVTNILAGSGISITSSTGSFTINTTQNIINASNLYLWANFR